MITLTEGLEKQVSILLASCRRVMTSPSDVHRILPVLGRPLEQFLFQKAGGSCRLSTPRFHHMT